MTKHTRRVQACGLWGGIPKQNQGFVCTEPLHHKSDHISTNIDSGEVRHRWSNMLDQMTRVEAARAMASYVGASQDQINAAEADGRNEARTGARTTQPTDALEFLSAEAFWDEYSKMRTSAAKQVKLRHE